MTHSKEVRAEQNKLAADVRSDNCKYREAGQEAHCNSGTGF